MYYLACAALVRKKNSGFCVLEIPKRGVFNGKLDCKSGAAFFFAADVSKKWHSRHAAHLAAPDLALHSPIKDCYGGVGGVA